MVHTVRSARLRAAALLPLLALVIGLASSGAEAAKPVTTYPFAPLKLQSLSFNTLNFAATSTGGIQLVGTGVATFTFGKSLIPSNFTLTGLISTAGGTCPILDLQINPIDLTLLGINVKTSAICLKITASRTGLLGDLLCSLSQTVNSLLLSGLNANQVVSLLNSALSGSIILPIGGTLNLSSLLSDLTGVITDALTQLLSSSIVTGVLCGTTDILHLSLGPIHLDLLGLHVDLDNCHNGPVTVDISVGPNTLLGQLICSLAGLLHQGGSASQIAAVLQQILAILQAL